MAPITEVDIGTIIQGIGLGGIAWIVRIISRLSSRAGQALERMEVLDKRQDEDRAAQKETRQIVDGHCYDLGRIKEKVGIES